MQNYLPNIELNNRSTMMIVIFGLILFFTLVIVPQKSLFLQDLQTIENNSLRIISFKK